MAYLRFARDKRGYENTYVLHTGRQGATSRPRMLYLFRTPPNVKVGRLPLDEEAVRAIEENNPDVVFNWKKMLKVSGAPKANKTGKQPSATRNGGRRRLAEPRQERDGSHDLSKVAVAESPVDAEAQLSVESTLTEDQKIDPSLLEAEAHLEDRDLDDGGRSGDSFAGPDGDGHPVVTLMGYITLARLRARYSEIQARITEKLVDPIELQTMRTRAEALNPDRWMAIEKAVQGIERFEAEVDAIKSELGRRPPRSRRSNP